ncbi:GC-rich sequence DNA-binding factor-like protein-domain-containing protein [Melampsora americana]|nr:GC-rich sequence DNA-binding factor-like protein-domain-containing protein [Melampsora americana]
MGKRRNDLMDESDLDSSSNDSSDHEEFENNDLAAENELFQDPYQSKRSKKRKRHGKEDAVYGVFGVDDDEENFKKPIKVDKRLHKTPSFVPSNYQKPLDPDASGQDSSIQASGSQWVDPDSFTGSEDESGESESEKDDHIDDLADINEQDEKDTSNILRPKLGLGAGLGLGASASNNDFRAMLSSGSTNKGFKRAGIGSKTHELDDPAKNDSPIKENPEHEESPSLPRRSFLGASASDSGQPTIQKKPLSRAEQQHFAKLASSKQSSMGLKMLEKMGWKSGTGLGAKGEGIVTPLESKVRPKGMGLSYEGFEERTKQAKEEDRRSGKIVDDDEDSKGQKDVRSKKGTKVVREAWKAKPKTLKKKNKVIHRTYEDIISELANDPENAGLDSGLGEIIDLTGRKLPSLNTTLLHHSKGPTEESKAQRLPELMYNLALICDMGKGNLINLAKEGSAIKQKQEKLAKDRARSVEMMMIKEQKLNNMKKIIAISSKIKVTYLNILNIINQDTKGEEICGMLEQFDESFNELLEFLQDDQRVEYEDLNLDEIVVSALAPILRRVWQNWDVLQQPNLSVPELKRFKKCFRLEHDLKSSHRADSNVMTSSMDFDYENATRDINANRKMTAYESLIWNDWVPKIRSTVNSWNPFQCEEMIEVFIRWKSLLPQFVHDNFLDQLIVPRLVSSIDNWDFRDRHSNSVPTHVEGVRSMALHLFVFPWLEHLGSYRNELVLQEVKLKLATWMKAWKFTTVEDNDKEQKMIQDLLVWKRDVFKRRDWDKLVLKNLVPNLAGYLKAQLIINPRQQDLKAFNTLLRWTTIITNAEILNGLFSEFFVKWLETLWQWLVADTGKPDEIKAWSNWWKSVIPDHLNDEVPTIRLGFARGIDLMNQASSLSSLDIKTKLAKPDLLTRPLIDLSSPQSRQGRSGLKTKSKVKRQAGLGEEVTFISIVEEEALKLNLFIIQLGKSLESDGMYLYRVSREYQSKQKHSSGLVFYIKEDVVYVKPGPQDGIRVVDWEPMAVDEMLAKASALSKDE